MMNTLKGQENLLQLLLQTGQGRNEKEEAKNVLTAFLDIFECTSGSLIKIDKTGQRLFLSLPETIPGRSNEEINTILLHEDFKSRAENIYVSSSANSTRYLVKLINWGYLHLIRKDPFDEDFIKRLLPVVTHVAFLMTRIAREDLNRTNTEKLENLSLIATKTSDMVIVTNPKGEITFVNEAFEQISGYTFNEVLGKKPGSFLQGPGTSHETRQEINEALHKRETVRTEILNYSKSGSTYWQNLTINPVFNDQGECVAFVSINKDITDLKELEKQIRRKENIVMAISKSTDILLSGHEVMDAIIQGLVLIGEAAEVDRTYLFQNSYDAGNNLVTSQRFEWNSGVVEPQIDNPELQEVPISIFDTVLDELYHKREFKSLIKDIDNSSDLKELLESQQIISILLIPIFIKDFFWGFIGYDECKYERTWDIDEISLLKSFSNSISSAIEREAAIRDMNNMVLFPQENPNPLFRVNLKGELLLRNKAAEKIDYFIFENQKFPFAEFARKVSSEVNAACPEKQYELEYQNEIFQLTVLLSQNGIHVNCYASNVTTLKNIQNELQRLSLVARINRRGVLFTDNFGRINYANEAFLKNTGYTSEEALGISPVELCKGPQTDEASIDALTRAYQNNLSIDLEIIIYRKDRSWFWANVKLQPLERDANDKAEFFSIIEDISEKKLAEETLKDSENRLSSLIRNLKEAILLEDQNRRIVLTNENFCRMFNIPVAPELLTGADCSTSADDSKHLFKNPDKFVLRIDEILKKKKMVLSEELEMTNGQYLERDYIPITIENIYRGHLWKYQDITERKNYEKTLKLQEEKYRNIIANMNMGLFEVGENKRIQHVNQQMAEMSGYPIEELLDKNPVDIFIEEEYRQAARDNRLFCTSGSTEYSQVKVHTKNGDCKWWLVSGAPNFNDEGNCIGSVNLCFDNTEQRRLEEELKMAMNKAEESSKAKESFLAHMSHEIRTPLNVITGLIREVSKEPLSDRQQNFIKKAGMAGKHLLSIVNDILDISKIEAGLLLLEHRVFDLREVIKDTIELEQPIANEKMLKLVADISSETGKAYIGDPVRVRQILMNLISNAIKFTNEGEITILCTTGTRNETLHEVIISVTDTGIGMEESYLKDIFNKFTQEDASTARKYGGTGLGMPIIHELVNLMEGTIDIQSKKNHGTRVSITLPLRPGREQDLQRSVVADNYNALENKHILLVEDNEINRLVATSALSSYNVRITEAADGLEAIEWLKKSAFDIVLMDLQMPNMDGLEATRHIRNVMKLNTPVIALTANAFKSEIDRCLQAGMNDYVTKPFEEEVLLSALLRNLGVKLSVTGSDSGEKPENMTKQKLYSLDQIEKFSRGNSEFIHNMTSLFLEDTPKSLSQLTKAFEMNDLPTVRSVAHKMKSPVEMFGIEDATVDLKTIEKMATEGHGGRAMKEALDRVVSTLNHAVAQLSEDPVFKKEQ
jgi:PAS domain S-box-containing protein